MMRKELTAENMEAVVGGCATERNNHTDKVDNPSSVPTSWNEAKLVASAIWTKLFD